MNESYIKNVVEAAMLAAGRPLQVAELAQLFDENSRPDVPAIRAALTSLEADYTGRGIEVKETATGFRIQVRRDMANEVSRLWPERPPKYTRALLETLALIAYRQPITRAEIEAVRGVAVNPNIVKTLLERNWVRVLGTRDVPGRPELLGTTKDFLDYFGLRSLEDLPPLADLKAMGDVNLQLDLSKDETPAAAPTDAGSGSDAAAAASAGASSEDSRDAVNGEHVAGDSNGAPDGAGVATASDEVEGAAVARATEVTAAADTASDVSDEARAEALLEASEGAEVASAADGDRADLDVVEGESAAEAESVADASEDSPREEREAGPQKRAAEAFVAEFDGDDADASGSDDDSADEDELSADSQGSSELVAGPRHLDD